MNYSELNEVVDEIIAAWPVFSPQERRGLLIRKLENQEYLKAKEGIDALTMTYKGMPTIADIIDAIKNAKVKIEIEDCDICDNEGWILIDPTGHGTYKKCTCANQGAKETRFFDDPNHTSEGKLISGFDEACWALYKGCRDDFDERGLGASDEEVCKALAFNFPERAARLRELLDEKYSDVF